MHAIKVLSPRPEIPFTNISFEGLCSDVRKFKNCDQNSGCNGGYYNSDYSHYRSNVLCDVTAAVAKVIDNVSKTVVGFQLQSLKTSKTNPFGTCR